MSADTLGTLGFGFVDLPFPHPEDIPAERTRDGIPLGGVAAGGGGASVRYVARVVRGIVQSNPSARASRVRQQLTYITFRHRAPPSSSATSRPSCTNLLVAAR